MTDTIEESEDYADNIVSAEAYEAPLPLEKEFFPWHKPRKHFVRSWQWEEQIIKLIDEHPIEGDTLKYLGLPGNDLLDIRHFHDEICSSRSLKLRYLGFNTALNPEDDNQTDANISIDEVSKLPNIDPRSEVLPDDFCKVVNDSSPAWQKAVDLGPYHILNLDLCDGFGAHEPDPVAETYYNATGKLLALQAKSKVPWLLFLTTRVGSNHVNSVTLERLKAIYQNNLDNCMQFKERSENLFHVSDKKTLEDALTDKEKHLPVFVAGLCKWLTSLSVQYSMKVELKSVVGYRVEDGAIEMDLVSFALKFTPVISQVVDKSGLSGNAPIMLTECQFSPQILHRISKIVDADLIMKEKQDIQDEMTNQSSRLLKLARYDTEKYKAQCLEWSQKN